MRVARHPDRLDVPAPVERTVTRTSSGRYHRGDSAMFRARVTGPESSRVAVLFDFSGGPKVTLDAAWVDGEVVAPMTSSLPRGPARAFVVVDGERHEVGVQTVL